MYDVTKIYFVTDEGPDCTSFDTHDPAELLELFHNFLIENHMTLVAVIEVRQVTE